MKKKKLRSLWISLGVILAFVLAVAGIGYAVINSLKAAGVVSDRDITSTIQVGGKNLLPIPIVLVLIVILLIVFWKKSSKFNFLLKWESCVAFLLTVVISLATLVFGPMQGLMNANNAGSSIKKVSASTVNQSDELSKKITNEGTVLLKNDNDFLPMSAQDQRLRLGLKQPDLWWLRLRFNYYQWGS